MAGKAAQLRGQGQDLPQQRTRGDRSRPRAGAPPPPSLPPLHHPRRRPGALGRSAPTHAALASCSIADDGGGQGRALAAILAVQVLDDLLAPLVFEVDVDVRRFGALARNEPFHQQRVQPLADGGDAQAVAHQRVGGRAAALAKDLVVAGELDDVVHRQEERFVAFLGDQRELVLDLPTHLGAFVGGCARGREMPGETVLGQPAQITRRRLSGRNDLPVQADGDAAGFTPLSVADAAGPIELVTG